MQPYSLCVVKGRNVSFAVQVEGYDPTFQWQIRTSDNEWKDISENIISYAEGNVGISGVSLVAEEANNGNRYRRVISNWSGTNQIISDEVQLTLSEDGIEYNLLNDASNIVGVPGKTAIVFCIGSRNCIRTDRMRSGVQ